MSSTIARARRLRWGVFAGVALVLVPAAATAAPEPTPTLVLEPPTVAPGGRFTATLEDFCDPDDDLAITFQIDRGESTIAPCRGDGLAIASLQAPTTPDEYTVRAFGLDLIATATLEVRAGLGGPDEPLPDTGPEHTLPLLAGGAALLVAGLALLRAARALRPTMRR